jgi:hypothetical protein
MYNEKILRNLAANAFWRSRNAPTDWTTGYWYGLFQGYKFAAETEDPWHQLDEWQAEVEAEAEAN